MKEEKFYNIRDIIENAIRKYSDNVAFRIKHNVNKKIEYTDITYKQMQKDIYALGTAIN